MMACDRAFLYYRVRLAKYCLDFEIISEDFWWGRTRPGLDLYLVGFIVVFWIRTAVWQTYFTVCQRINLHWVDDARWTIDRFVWNYCESCSVWLYYTSDSPGFRTVSFKFKYLALIRSNYSFFLTKKRLYFI